MLAAHFIYEKENDVKYWKIKEDRKRSPSKKNNLGKKILRNTLKNKIFK